MLQQFENLAIWRIESWVNKIGTGKFVKRENHKIKIYGVEPIESAFRYIYCLSSAQRSVAILVYKYCSRLCFNQCITLYIIYYICYM